MSHLPSMFNYWPDHAKDTYLEREAIMREGNNIPDNVPTPMAIRMEAIRCAEREIQSVKDSLKASI